MSESGTVATYGGINIPPVTVFMDGFLQGVNYYNEENGTEVEVLGWDGTDGSFAGNFENLDDGKNSPRASPTKAPTSSSRSPARSASAPSAFATENRRHPDHRRRQRHGHRNPAKPRVPDLGPQEDRRRRVRHGQAIVVNGEYGGAYLGTLENGGVGLAPFAEGAVDARQLATAVTDLQAEIISGDVTVGG